MRTIGQNYVPMTEETWSRDHDEPELSLCLLHERGILMDSFPECLSLFRLVTVFSSILLLSPPTANAVGCLQFKLSEFPKWTWCLIDLVEKARKDAFSLKSTSLGKLDISRARRSGFRIQSLHCLKKGCIKKKLRGSKTEHMLCLSHCIRRGSPSIHLLLLLHHLSAKGTGTHPLSHLLAILKQ